MKKLLIFSALFACMCASLTGCTIQLDDGDIETFEKMKDMTNVTVNGNYVDTNEIVSTVYNNIDVPNYMYNNMNDEETYFYPEEDSRVEYSYIDLGNSYYIIVYGHDDEGNTTWTYETEKALYTENRTSEYLSDFNDEVVFVLDNSNLVCLNIDDGSVIWEIQKKYIVSPYYNIDNSGTIYLVYGETATEFMVVDLNGKILSQIDLAKYDFGLTTIPNANWIVDFGDTEITMIGSSESEFSQEKIVNINLNNYSVSVKDIEHKNVTANMLKGKDLYYEYGDIYYFNEDGTFEQYVNGYVEKYSILRYSGTWKVENSVLKLNITSEIMANGGHYEYDDYGERMLVDYDEENVSTNIEVEYELKYYPDYNGEELVGVDGTLYHIAEPVG